jgi:hypothetical protein
MPREQGRGTKKEGGGGGEPIGRHVRCSRVSHSAFAFFPVS